MEPNLNDTVNLPPFLQNLFEPVLFASTPVVISTEQTELIRALLLLTSSDTRFAQKAADGLRIILNAGVNGGVVPAITTLSPSTAPTGTPSVPVTVNGSGFDASCLVFVNGNAVVTTFVSPTQLTVNLNLTGVTRSSLPVIVRNALGIYSNIVNFSVT